MKLFSQRIFPVLLAFVAAVSAVKADWPFFRGDALASGVSKDELPEHLELLWEYKLTKGWFEASPVIAEGTVFLGSSEDRFLAIDLETGKERWHAQNESGFLVPAIYVRDSESTTTTEHGGLLVVGDPEGKVHAFDSRDGRERWSFPTEAVVDNSPNLWEGKVLFGSQNGNLYCLEANTGALVWKYAIPDQIRCCPPVVDKTGFVAGCDGQLHIVDLEKGEGGASVDFGAPTGSTPAVLGDRLFFGTEGNEFLAVDWKKAEVVWRFPLKQSVRAPAAVVPGRVVFGAFDRTIYALDPENGELQWSFKAKGRIEGGPIIAGKRVYCGATDANFYVLDLESGKLLQKLELSDQVLGSPAVDKNRLVVGTADGVLSCFGKKSIQE